MEATVALPSSSNLSPHLLGFLDHRFRTLDDLLTAPDLAVELSKTCSDLDSDLSSLHRGLKNLVVSWSRRSIAAKAAVLRLNYRLQDLGAMAFRNDVVLCRDLPRLARELLRVEALRGYVETALRLEALVGDLEDAIFSEHVAVTLKQERVIGAVKIVADIDSVLENVAEFRPRWRRLLNSVDDRVDKALGVLRTRVVANHRTLLSSLGWPPKLSVSKIENGGVSAIPNPLVLMLGEKRESYSQSFVALCALQHVRGKRRRIDDLRFNAELWAIDELVSPIASRIEYHSSNWLDKPEFIFALVRKITCDFVVGVEEILQPLIDEARLVGCSAKEAWVSAMVKMLSGFLGQRVISVLAQMYEEREKRSEVGSSWLHLIDLIVSFDKQMLSLVKSEGYLIASELERFEGFSRDLSVMSMFCDRLDWLKIWAKIELRDAYKKLNAESKDDRAWFVENKKGADVLINREIEQFLLSTREDHRAPAITESALKITWEMIDRGQSLPAISSRIKFIRRTAARFLWHFFDVLLSRWNDTNLSLDFPDDETVMRACGLINAAGYCEFKLQQWSDDVNFLEMKMAETESNDHVKGKTNDNNSCFFDEEIKRLDELETDWLMSILANLLRQFELLSWEYIENMKQFDHGQNHFCPTRTSVAMDLVISHDLVLALDALRSHLLVIEKTLNPRDFLDLWRSVADGLDHFIFRSIFGADIRFSREDVHQIGADMKGLFFVFRPFCARPEAFFPCIRESRRLLEMDEEEVKYLQAVLASDDENRIKCLRSFGVSHVSFDRVDKILRNRTF